jgi:hypothetical protein
VGIDQRKLNVSEKRGKELRGLWLNLASICINFRLIAAKSSASKAFILSLTEVSVFKPYFFKTMFCPSKDNSEKTSFFQNVRFISLSFIF